MKNDMLKLTSALLAASLLAVGGTAIAAGGKEPGKQTTVDCKKNPEDASCKEAGKGK